MLLDALFAVAGSMAVFFLLILFIYLMRTYTWERLKRDWERAKVTGTRKHNRKQQIKEWQAEGLQEFVFPNGTVWAKNQFQAAYLYQTGKFKAAIQLRAERRNKKEKEAKAISRQQKIKRRQISIR